MEPVEACISLRELMQLLLLSASGAWLLTVAFRGNPESRRSFVLGLFVALGLLPLAWPGSPFALPFPVARPPRWFNDVGVPMWLIGLLVVPGCVLALGVMRRSFRQQHALQALPECADPRVQRMLGEACLPADMPMQPKVVVHPDTGPASGTLSRPVIVLPSASRDWDDKTLHGALIHEWVHVQHRDDLWLLIVRMMTCFYWWMPWLRTLERHYLETTEERCDDLAGEQVGELPYVESLVRIANGKHALQSRPVMSDEATVRMSGGRRVHLLSRLKRFHALRVFETDSRGVYWSLLGVVALSVTLSGVQPVQKVEALTGTFKPLGLNAATPSTNLPQVVIDVRTDGVDPRQHARLEDRSELRHPMYPGRALSAGIGGEVIVSFELAADGSLGRLAIVSADHPLLVPAALDAARASQFPPLHAINDLRIAGGIYVTDAGAARLTHSGRLHYRFEPVEEQRPNHSAPFFRQRSF